MKLQLLYPSSVNEGSSKSSIIVSNPEEGIIWLFLQTEIIQ